MRINTELGILGAAVVYLSFFSWPIPKVIRDVLQTGIGRFVALAGVVYLAKYQSVALAILAAIFYSKAVRAAYHENFEVKEEKKDEKKKEEPKKGGATPPPPAVAGNVPASPGSSASAIPSMPPKTEHYQNFAPF